MQGMTDLHCHLLPYVDDGAYDLMESRRLLREQVKQGVRTICFTPHLRTRMFETPEEKILQQFSHVKQLRDQEKLPLQFALSREYFCDSTFFRVLQNNAVRPMGRGRTLLVEYSRGHSFSYLLETVQKIVQSGYSPLIAHVERYPAVQDVEKAKQLFRLGARLQVNAGSILGSEGREQKQFCKRLLQSNLVTIVASDSHDMENRAPNLAQCAAYLEKRYGKEQTRRLLRENPLRILQGK